MFWLKRFWPLLLGLLYLVSPVDALPDTILGLGWIDDILLGILAYWFYKRLRSGWYEQAGTSRSNGQGRQETSTDKDPYEILGLSSGATMDEIKSAYRKEAQRYHPDRVSHLGEEFQEMAKQKFQDIQKAYEILSRRAR